MRHDGGSRVRGRDVGAVHTELVQPEVRRRPAQPSGEPSPDDRADRGPVRRIREDLRDGVYVMAFSCLASTVTALAIVAFARLAG